MVLNSRSQTVRILRIFLNRVFRIESILEMLMRIRINGATTTEQITLMPMNLDRSSSIRFYIKRILCIWIYQ